MLTGEFQTLRFKLELLRVNFSVARDDPIGFFLAALNHRFASQRHRVAHAVEQQVQLAPQARQIGLEVRHFSRSVR